jgi:hypothetical protein
MPYVDRTDFVPQLTARLTEAQAELAEVLIELPRAEAALVAAKEASFVARARHAHLFCAPIARQNSTLMICWA